MYKATTEAAHYLTRAASHSTKGFRNGRVEVLPPSAKAPIYDDLTSRRAKLLAMLEDSTQQLKKIQLERDSLMPAYERHSNENKKMLNARGLRTKKPPILEDFERRAGKVKSEYLRLVHEVKEVNKALGYSNSEERAQRRQEEFAVVFRKVARQLLDSDTFEKLTDEAKRQIKLSQVQP